MTELVETAIGTTDPDQPGADPERRGQRAAGVAKLAKGLFSAFRNPAAHEPKLLWAMTEQDALDVLGTLSLIHRRLDQADVVG